jgi:phosphomannomutase
MLLKNQGFGATMQNNLNTTIMDISIFKSYDIRGIYPSQINEEAVFAAAKAFVQHTKAQNIVVGHDARLSSPNLFKALVSGLSMAGAAVTSIGQTPTEGVYFAIGHYDFDAAIMVTASHNPKEYNGLKMMRKNGEMIEMVRGKDLVQLAQEEVSAPPSETPTIQKFDVWPDYQKFMTSFAGNIHPLKIVVDASNGVIGSVVQKIKEMLPVEITELNFEPDGNFPHHSPNPLEKGSSDQITKAIQENHAHCGFMFDGDADRVFLVDEKGILVSADITLLLLAKYFLHKRPGAGIAYNAICSKAVPEFVGQWGGVAIKTPVGFVNVRDGLIKNNGVMGGELSGHYCFADYFYMDSGIMAFLILLQVISQGDKPVSVLTEELSPYFKAAEMNFTINDKDAVLKKITEKYADGTQDSLDGITVEYIDWWFNARPSNTEPVLRLTIEANTKELLEEKKKELTDFINN